MLQKIRLAICDDDAEDLNQIFTLVNSCASAPQLMIQCFSSGADVLQAAEHTPFDIVLLDIEMSAPNGFETGVQLRKQPNPPLILFVTNSMAYTVQGYGVAFRYLPKPLTPEQLQVHLDAALQEVLANRLTLESDGGSFTFPLQDIYYIEVVNHRILVHTADELLESRMTLKETLALLPQLRFGTPHQSYIVNFSHIKAAFPQELYLTNGVKLPVSRRRQAEFMTQFHRFLGR